MGDKWIRKTTGVVRPVALAHVMFCLTIGLLIGALTPAAAVAMGVPQRTGSTALTVP